MKLPVIPPWAKPLGAVLLMAAVLGAIYAYGQQQFGLGEKAERTAWLNRENTALTKANTQIKALEDKYRAQEQKHAQDMAAASAKYQEDLMHEKDTKDRVIADLRSGALRLRVPVTCPDGAGGSGTAAPGPSTIGRDGETRAELSISASEFLVGLANEADQVVRQLTACQAVVFSDRQAQGGQ